MIDTDLLILLNCMASWGNFNANNELLKDKKHYNVERLLEAILEELVILNERLKDGNELSGKIDG